MYWWIYWPATEFSFRAEQWAFLEFYKTKTYPKSGSDWLEIAFWTPFHDYRLLPLAYLLHYFEYLFFEGDQALFVIFSLGIYQANALLCGFLVTQLLSRGHNQTIITFAVVSFLPAALEVTVWSFFSYKLLQITFCLSSLILLEKALEKDRKILVLFLFFLIFLSSLFYEATLLILIFHGFRILVKKRNWWPYSFLSVSLIVFYFIIWLYFKGLVGELGLTHNLSINFDFEIFTESAFNWAFYSWLLGNSGLELQFVSSQAYSKFIPILSEPRLSIIIIAWALFLLSLKLERVMFEAVAVLFSVLILLSIPVLIGRTITNGPDYLAGFSMYSYHAVIFLGSIFSVFFGTQISEKSKLQTYKKNIRLVSFSLFLFLWVTALYGSLASYLSTNEFQNRLIKVTSDLVVERNANIVVSARNTPFNTTATDINFFFSAMKFLHPDKVFKDTEGLHTNTVIIDDFLIEIIRQNKSLSYLDLIAHQERFNSLLSNVCEKLFEDENSRLIITPMASNLIDSQTINACLNYRDTHGSANIFVIDIADLNKIRDVDNFEAKKFLQENYQKWNSTIDPILEAFSNVKSHPVHPIKYIFDSKIETNWSTLLSEKPRNIELQFQFPNVRTIRKVTLHPRQIEDNFFIEEFQLFTVKNNGHYEPVGSYSGIQDGKTPVVFRWEAIQADNIILRTKTVESKFGNKVGLQISEIEFE